MTTLLHATCDTAATAWDSLLASLDLDLGAFFGKKESEREIRDIKAMSSSNLSSCLLRF